MNCCRSGKNGETKKRRQTTQIRENIALQKITDINMNLEPAMFINLYKYLGKMKIAVSAHWGMHRTWGKYASFPEKARDAGSPKVRKERQ